MSINLTDEIEVKTKKGKLGAAKQIFLEGDTQTVEKEIQDINSRHNDLSSKHESLSSTVSEHTKQIKSNQSQITANKSAQDKKNISLDANMAKLNTRDDQITELVKGITATGGASVATAVTYDNTSSQLASATVQGAVDELQSSKINKTSILQESGDDENSVMSQKATTTAIIATSNKLSQIEEELEKVKISIQGVIINSDGITPDLTTSYIWADVKLPLLANVTYILKISGNFTFNQSANTPYYQIVGTNLQNQESIIDTYVSKNQFVEENIKIKPTQNVYLRIRARGYESGKINIEVISGVLERIEDLQNQINNISIDTVKGLFEKEEQIHFEVKDNYYWASPNKEPIARPNYSCTNKIAIKNGETIKTKDWEFPAYAAILFDNDGNIVKGRINSNEFTTESDGSKTYVIQDDNVAYIGLNYYGVYSDNPIAKIYVVHLENEFNYYLIEEKIQQQIDDTIKVADYSSIDVYIIAGQSNADGRGYINQLEAAYKRRYTIPYLWQNRIDNIENIYSPTSTLKDRFGIELSIAGELEFRNTNAIILKRAIGGIPLYPLSNYSYCWKIGESNSMYPLLKTMIDKVKKLNEGKTINWKFIWLQGETDAEHQESAAAYQQNMEELISQLKTDTSESIKIAIGKLKESTYGDYIAEVNQAFENIASSDANVTVVDTDSLQLYDAYHYTTDSFNKLGIMMYNALNE